MSGTGIDGLIAQLGSERVKTRESSSSDGGLETEAIVFADTEEQARSVVRWASREGVAIVPQGKGGWGTYGNSIRGRAITLSLARMNGIVEHSPGDLIVTVRAGTTLADLQKQLKEKGQVLPLDPGWPEHITAGGLVATASTGPKRLKYGAPRDWVTGLRMILANGQMIRTGGKVVKNVAGYDMNKCFVGSMGTLGIITECTFKLRPLPPAETVLVLTASDGETMMRFSRRVWDSSLEPCAMELVNGTALRSLTGLDGEGCAWVIGFEDEEKAVTAQRNLVARWAEEEGLSIRAWLEQEQAASLWNRLGRLTPNALETDISGMEVALKAITLPDRVAGTVWKASDVAEKQGIEAIVHGGIGTGITRVNLFASMNQLDQVCETIGLIRSWLEERSGYLVVEHAPLCVKNRVPVWGRTPGGFGLMRKLKGRLDPGSLFNPGRFVGGI
ncbi:FAD-binding oxidoreductase [Lihuaxuella thermophila]|uniref:Glycolate oxidase FAD binding subunit n=1 Tax=Lihuaxuella thermophila TaxID=1173111 RepID=A0A1H8J7J1_9BACL|nr:FAD-binding oxidoreductase [Lihuaxuella thermophila]SEN76873.1 glycolate oxidase FAD binding subunit [Lihuaxuella thermophila]